VVKIMDRKTEFKFEGTDPLTNKRFKILLEGWVPDDLISLVQEQITRIISGDTTKLVKAANSQFVDTDSWTIKDKVKHLIFKQLKHGWFNSNDMIEQYAALFNEKIKPSTATMVLQRLTKYEGILERRGTRSQHSYRLLIEQARAEVKKAEGLKLLK
jgi:hypothetical protein